MGQIASEPFRAFLARTWTRAKQWIDTSDVPASVLVQRLRPQFEEYRRQLAEAAQRRAAESKKTAAELAAYQQRLKDAGITPEGLVELIDAQRTVRTGADRGQTGRNRRRRAPVTGLRDQRSEPAAGQGKARPAAARRLCDRAGRGPCRRPQAVRAGPVTSAADRRCPGRPSRRQATGCDGHVAPLAALCLGLDGSERCRAAKRRATGSARGDEIRGIGDGRIRVGAAGAALRGSAAAARRWPLCRRHGAAAHGIRPCAALAPCACPYPRDRHVARKSRARRAGGADRRRLA